MRRTLILFVLSLSTIFVGTRNAFIYAEDSGNSPVLSMEKINDQEIRVYVDGNFFAAYRADFKGTPIVWPICAPNGSLATRAWPMIDSIDVGAEKDPVMKKIYQNAIVSEHGGVKDHPHHRSLWFNHGDVLGGDFWGGTPSTIRQTKLIDAQCDGQTVKIVTENYWHNDKMDRDICKDVRTLVFGVMPDLRSIRYLDFSIEIVALQDSVVFGDTKEGSFGVRMPSPTAMTSSKLSPQWGGQILNDAGETGDATWGKRSKWVDYTGPVAKFLEGAELEKELAKKNDDRSFPLTKIGIAVLSGSNSLGAPAWRHVRDYGLFSSNPFGQRDFEPNNPKADGTQKLNKDDIMSFNFRVLFHDGDLTVDELNKAFQEYAK